MNPSLLIELFTEELPPKSLEKLSRAFAESIVDALRKSRCVDHEVVFEPFGTPRRLGVLVKNVSERSPDLARKDKVLPVAVALDNRGQATPPLIKKLAAMGLTEEMIPRLTRESDGKQDVLFYEWTAPGVPLTDVVQTALNLAIEKLPIPKVMSYQRLDETGNSRTWHFVRPAHRLVALHGMAVLPVQALGLVAGRVTKGHRFMSSGEISIDTADAYAEILESRGRVIASYEARRSKIGEALRSAATRGEANGGDQVVMPQSLLDEVNSLVEWPVIYEGQFESGFLLVPQECLILTMQQNQKYFAVTDSTGRMKNRFLLVSNLESTDPQVVIGGNERVLRARLADARFFFEQDRKRTLESRVPSLANVVYHNKLGTQLERVERVESLAKSLAQALQSSHLTDPAHAARAARLAKADLLTDMVGEFPELQGVMGTYYALHDGEAKDVATAITEHYQPRFAGDALPSTSTGLVVALADKLETLIGIWGIGLAPTGEKDPFALRRHCLGILRMLIERQLPLSISAWLKHTSALFANSTGFKSAEVEIFDFILDRLRGLLRDRGYSAQEIESVVGSAPDRVDDILIRIDAVREFMRLPESISLTAANKRIRNILKKSDGAAALTINDQLLQEPAERALYEAVTAAEPDVATAIAENDPSRALTRLSVLKSPVDTFFDQVMVMAEDPALRNNRIALLAQLDALMNQVADLSALAT